MMKRKYTHVKEIESVIISLREAGLTRQEIADELGLQKSQIKDWVRRYNQRREQLQKGIIPKRTGRPHKHPLTTSEEYQREIARLQNRGVFVLSTQTGAVQTGREFCFGHYP